MSLTFRKFHPHMHRATPFDDARYRRELRRVTTLDLEPAPLAASAS